MISRWLQGYRKDKYAPPIEQESAGAGDADAFAGENPDDGIKRLAHQIPVFNNREAVGTNGLAGFLGIVSTEDHHGLAMEQE